MAEEHALTTTTSSWQSLSKKFMALLGFSRAYIGFFVLAQSALGAVLALKQLPSLDSMIIGAIACLAGSYSFVAYNDLLDAPIDKMRFDNKLRDIEGFDMGSAFERHPVAKGIISYRLAVVWVLAMVVISALGIAYLKPSLVAVLPIIAIFVTAYSLLSLRSPLKVLAVAIAVTLGGTAGWIAVSSTHNLLFWLFVAWTFCWEIGGRNIPNDFNDVEEDREIGIKTFPVIMGCDAAAHIIMIFLSLTALLSVPMAWLATHSYIVTVIAIVIATFLLLIPGLRLMQDSIPQKSLRLYNRSAFYPPTMLVLFILAFYM